MHEITPLPALRPEVPILAVVLPLSACLVVGLSEGEEAARGAFAVTASGATAVHLVQERLLRLLGHGRFAAAGSDGRPRRAVDDRRLGLVLGAVALVLAAAAAWSGAAVGGDGGRGLLIGAACLAGFGAALLPPAAPERGAVQALQRQLPHRLLLLGLAATPVQPRLGLTAGVLAIVWVAILTLDRAAHQASTATPRTGSAIIRR